MQNFDLFTNNSFHIILCSTVDAFLVQRDGDSRACNATRHVLDRKYHVLIFFPWTAKQAKRRKYLLARTMSATKFYYSNNEETDAIK
jgi:hypothetical protein